MYNMYMNSTDILSLHRLFEQEKRGEKGDLLDHEVSVKTVLCSVHEFNLPTLIQ